MEILRRKFVVGVVSRMNESLLRFYGFFGWRIAEEVTQCQTGLLEPSKDSHFSLPQGKALSAIVKKNKMDIKLYQYILYMFNDLQITAPPEEGERGIGMEISYNNEKLRRVRKA